MAEINLQLLSILELAIFLTAVLMHIVRRNAHLVSIYVLQSLAVVCMLLLLGISEQSTSLLMVALITFFVKVVSAPAFFTKLIGKKQLGMSATTYISLPLTLGLILGLTVLVKTGIFAPIVSLFPHASQLIAFALSGILISLFLVINRRGVFSQIMGILSFENGLVAFSTLAGLEQTFAIEMGILFDILLWIVISSVLVTLVYSHFGSLDTQDMRKLKD